MTIPTDTPDWQTRIVGLPNQIIVNGVTLAAGTQQTVDISGYAGLIIYCRLPQGVTTYQLACTQLDTAATLNVTDDFYLDASTAGWNFPQTPLRWNVSGNVLLFRNPLSTAVVVYVIGTLQRFPKRASCAIDDINGTQLSVNFAAAGVVAFPADPDGCHPEGPCYVRFALTGGNTTRGSLRAQTRRGTLTLFEASDLVAQSTSASASKIVYLPVGGYNLTANISTFSAAGAASVDIIPAL